MNKDIRNIEPKAVWNHFADLNAVPRPSKKEERIIQFMVDFGKKLNLETLVDDIGNVIIKKSATAGMENCKTVVLQAHIDMVPQKNADKEHDFEKDPIEAYVFGSGYNTVEWFVNSDYTSSGDSISFYTSTEEPSDEVVVTALVKNEYCEKEITKIVKLTNIENFYIPNAFTPNGDNINDLFIINELDSVPGKLVVWNRWGDIVYQTNKYNNDWGGTCEAQLCFGQGQQLPEGTYFYQVDAKGITKEGYVTLKR